MFIREIGIKLLHEFRTRIQFFDTEQKLEDDAQEYWNQASLKKSASHWRDNEEFDEQNWLELGKEHMKLMNSFAGMAGLRFPVNKIVEWGCGGGANAVQFGALTKIYFGVDINAETLDECSNQMKNWGYDNFRSVLIMVDDPEAGLIDEMKDSDLFICTYVFELIPSPEYGLRLLRLANQVLKVGGVGLIQIRYNDLGRRHGSRKWGYKFKPYHMTTYSLEEFWNYALAFGFQPLAIYLVPEQKIVGDVRYGYYFIKKTKNL